LKLLMLIVLLPLWSWAGPSQNNNEIVKPLSIQTAQGEARILVNSFGQALYVFDPDGTGTPKCAADCAEKWPPLLVSADEAKQLKEPLGSVERTNGLIQVTFKGRPLYTFFLDRKVGDIKGDGLGNVWHVGIIAERRFRRSGY
jgi:predicted lipoprotein with Yx(FWY)xxD motif